MPFQEILRHFPSYFQKCAELSQRLSHLSNKEVQHGLLEEGAPPTYEAQVKHKWSTSEAQVKH